MGASSSGAHRLILVAAADTRIRVCGRNVIDVAAGTVSFDWPATSIEFSTTAKRIWLRMDGGSNYFNVLCNGELVGVLPTKRGVRDYAVHDVVNSKPVSSVELGRSACVIQLQKRTEACIGTLCQTITGRCTRPAVIHGLLLENQEGTLVELPQAPTRKIEFLGDSETSGFGNLGPSQPGDEGSLRSALMMSPAHQDAYQSWPSMVARELCAQFHVIAWSSVGVLWNGTGCTARGNFRTLYPQLLGSQHSVSTSATMENNVLHSWIPDIVVMYLGGNDWWTLPKRGDSELIAGFRDFLIDLRGFRPAAIIAILVASRTSYCSCIPNLSEQERFSDDMLRCWEQAVLEARDERTFIDIVDPSPRIDVSDPADWGQMGHWSVQGHAKWARAVSPLIAARMSW